MCHFWELSICVCLYVFYVLLHSRYYKNMGKSAVLYINCYGHNIYWWSDEHIVDVSYDKKHGWNAVQTFAEHQYTKTSRNFACFHTKDHFNKRYLFINYAAMLSIKYTNSGALFYVYTYRSENKQNAPVGKMNNMNKSPNSVSRLLEGRNAIPNQNGWIRLRVPFISLV